MSPCLLMIKYQEWLEEEVEVEDRVVTVTSSVFMCDSHFLSVSGELHTGSHWCQDDQQCGGAQEPCFSTSYYLRQTTQKQVPSLWDLARHFIFITTKINSLPELLTSIFSQRAEIVLRTSTLDQFIHLMITT